MSPEGLAPINPYTIELAYGIRFEYGIAAFIAVVMVLALAWIFGNDDGSREFGVMRWLVLTVFPAVIAVLVAFTTPLPPRF